MSFVLSLYNVYSLKDILRYFKNGTFFTAKLNFGDSRLALAIVKNDLL